MVVLLYVAVTAPLAFVTFPVTVIVPVGLKMIVLAPVKTNPEPSEAVVIRST